MEFWLDIAAFAVKALLLVVAFGAMAAIVVAASRRKGGGAQARVQLDSINERNEATEHAFDAELLGKKERKAKAKARRKADKQAPSSDTRRRVFVVDFKGDLNASAVQQLAAQMSAVLAAARAGVDEIVVRVHSPGGTVMGYGLAAAELARAKARGVMLTACVDQVAASGGYMMACAAQKIIAAPFAIIGSIGVVAQVPNLNRLLRKVDIDYEEVTAGEHKRDVSLLGEITPEGRAHFREKIDATHLAFKDFVAAQRPNLDVAAVANGDHWLGTEALRLGLVDELMTSEEYLFRAKDEARLFEVASEEEKTLLDQIRKAIGIEGMFGALLKRMTNIA